MSASLVRGRARSHPSAERIQGAKEAQPLDELADERIHRDHSFGFQFPERHMDGPLIRASGTEAVGGQIGALTDAHAGVANQQKDIRAQVVAAEKLLLQQLILFGRKRTRQSVWKARDVLAPDQMSEVGKLFVHASSWKIQRSAISRLI